MKIIHIIDYFQPKLGYQEVFLAREHAKLGYDVYVVTSDRYNPIFRSQKLERHLLGGRIAGTGYFVEEGIKVWRLKPLLEIPHAIWLRGLKSKIQELKPDIVIVHGMVNFSALRVARLKEKTGGFRLIYDDHMTYDNSLSMMRVLYPLFKFTFSSLIQRAADALVAILPESRIFMCERYGIPPERVVIIPLGADDELFKVDTAVRREMRDKLKLGEDDVVFVFTGKIVPQKKLPLLIEAAAKLMADHDNVKVILVGSSTQSYIEQLKHEVGARNLEKRFVWHDAVPNAQLPMIYSAADVAVWPGGASISMREAMACGLPIIINEAALVTELVAYSNGLTFREDDASDLARQMEKLLDRELRENMGRSSRKLVEDRFSWKIIARQFIELVSEKPVRN